MAAIAALRHHRALMRDGNRAQRRQALGFVKELFKPLLQAIGSVSSDGKDEEKGENHGGTLQHETSLGRISGNTKVTRAAKTSASHKIVG
ncbi:hypothetical protein MesoLjLa_53180 [Mesorhizobium sp. L-2-11]|nr:hypothetical protein MesoLjLa_53180 [Mesorhizobium sp. L-2-11]